jgi:hypothetical protein
LCVRGREGRGGGEGWVEERGRSHGARSTHGSSLFRANWAVASRTLLEAGRVRCRELPVTGSEWRTDVVGSSTMTPLRPAPLSLKYL